MTSPIVDFYLSEGYDNRGRTLRTYFSWDDRTLEDVHDYIQWMFPLTERSGSNPHAPLLTEEDIESLQGAPWLKTSAHFFFNFLKRGERWGTRQFWVQPMNHNHLRITRVLKCLNLTGYDDLARDIYDHVMAVNASNDHIIKQAIPYWKEAMGE